MAVGVFSSAKGGACLRASDRDGLSCAAKYARREPACSYTYTRALLFDVVGPIYQAFIIYYHHLFVSAYLNVDGLKYMFPNLGLAKFALSLRKQDLRLLTGLLTGHVSLNRHLTIMKLRSDPLCPLCKPGGDCLEVKRDGY